mmetsp:Transcript_17414/g.49742  ORF Transcript_17414/g.49742 Transcript_17414/m.49742 type:complete len:270 (-) Transcript_17414:296-1105(-)
MALKYSAGRDEGEAGRMREELAPTLRPALDVLPRLALLGLVRGDDACGERRVLPHRHLQPDEPCEGLHVLRQHLDIHLPRHRREDAGGERRGDSVDSLVDQDRQEHGDRRADRLPRVEAEGLFPLVHEVEDGHEKRHTPEEDPGDGDVDLGAVRTARLPLGGLVAVAGMPAILRLLHHSASPRSIANLPTSAGAGRPFRPTAPGAVSRLDFLQSENGHVRPAGGAAGADAHRAAAARRASQNGEAEMWVISSTKLAGLKLPQGVLRRNF